MRGLKPSWTQIFLLGALFCCAGLPALAAGNSASLTGTLGLNTLPSARMDPAGTVRVTYGHLGQYDTICIGTQIADSLYLGLRQTGQEDDNNTKLYPAMDAKLRLFRENKYRPEIAIGLQSALGHKRMAAEYLAMSKRYENFDMTFGIGWGRLGTRQIIPNPALFKSFSGHNRTLDGDTPNKPSDWFTGNAGIFGGIEYDMPQIEGLSLKGEWSSDAWKAERAAEQNFKTPAPWSLGFSYRPPSYDWIDIGAAMIGTDSFMTRISFSPNLESWPLRSGQAPLPVALQDGRPERLPAIHKNNEKKTARELGLNRITFDKLTAAAELDINSTHPTAFQIGQSARHIANMAGKNPEQIAFRLSRYGLRGPSITINRKDLERAELKGQGSAEEIWRNVKLGSVLPERIRLAREKFEKSFSTKIDWISDISLSEDDTGILYRTAIIPTLTKRIGKHFLSEQAIRINLAHNLEPLTDYRGLTLYPVRGDIGLFTQNRFVLEKSYIAGLATPFKDVHIAGSLGYLEEMYAGATAEILYRPFDKPWALGIEINEAIKRDPYSPWATYPNGDKRLSGFINGYYELPKDGATLSTSLGCYLGGDVGGSLSLSNEFDSGAKLEAFLTATNKSDKDLYGGDTNLYAGMTLSLPLGSLPFLPDSSRAIVKARPLGRETGQRLENPVSLYEMTEPLSYRAITRHWSALTDRP